MLNLLPQSEKERFIRDYRMRFARAIAIGTCLLLIIASIGLLPSYASKKSVADDFARKQREADQKNTVESLEAAQARTAENKILADYLEVRIGTIKRIPMASSIVGKIFETAGPHVSVTAINVAGGNITVIGRASTRTELIAFHQRLKQESEFKTALLPIGDIAKSVDPEFAIQIALP